MPKSYYIEKLAPFSERINDCLITPYVYQPTPEGVTALCQHYSQKYTIDLRCVDLREVLEVGDNSRHFFTCLKNNPELLSIEAGKARGLILTHGQHHAIPVVVLNDGKKQNIIIFDSTSGSRIQGYFGIAELFPEAQIYLNSGTRQADGASCLTDAVCILKEALQINALMLLIQPKIIKEHKAFNPSRFARSKPDNFKLFHLPEQLLLTAQRSEYLKETQANTDVLLRGGRTLQAYRDEFKLQVSLLKHEGTALASINSYLFVKGKEHKKILDAYAAHENMFIPISNPRSISPLVSPSSIGFYANLETDRASNNPASTRDFSR